MGETTYQEIVEQFKGDESLVEAIAESIGIDRASCDEDEDFEEKVQYSYNSESGSNCIITNFWISSKAIWRASLVTLKTISQ